MNVRPAPAIIWLWMLLLLTFGSAGPIGCKGGKAASKSSKRRGRFWRKKKRSKPVHAARIKRGSIEAALSGTTTLTAEDQVTIVTQVNGLVRGVYGKEGRTFRRGAVLATLSNPYLKIAYENAKIQVKKLRRDLKRNKRLQRKGLVSRETSENLLFQLAQAENTMKRAQEDIRNLRIRATISGVVTTRHLRRGAWVIPQAPAFVMESPRSLVAIIAVPEKYYPRLRKGLEVQIKAEALGSDTSIAGQTIRIAPTVDAKTGTIAVTIGKLKPLKKLRSGMFLTANIILQRRKNIPLVPKQAVLYSNNKPYVYRLKGACKPRPLTAPSSKRKGRRGRKGRKGRKGRWRGRKGRGKRGTGSAKSDCEAEKVLFEKGLEDANSIEVRKGLSPGDRIITLGQQGLRKGSKIRVIKLEG